MTCGDCDKRLFILVPDNLVENIGNILQFIKCDSSKYPAELITLIFGPANTRAAASRFNRRFRAVRYYPTHQPHGPYASGQSFQ